ncbi:MLO-like protein 13 isoform X2 [Apium graveolens]
MLLGFISLLLTVSQGPISNMCISRHLASTMLPCKLPHESSSPSATQHFYLHQSFNNGRRHLLSEGSESQYCAHKGKVPLFSREAIHQLHIFIFVLAVVHVIFCATTMVLGGLKIQQWKRWEQSSTAPHEHHKHHLQDFKRRTSGYWRKYRLFGWIRSFFKQFYGSVTKSDYIALRHGFIQEHCRTRPNFNFHRYMLRTLEHDFKHMVGISWYLWLFVVLFLLLNLAGWHTYFWLSFLPLILLLLVGAHLEHIITRLARGVAERNTAEGQTATVKPSDDHFFMGHPRFILHLIHFILFQNSFEIAFFAWILTSYGFHSCIMEKIAYIIPRLVMGFIVQVLCSYITLPLYALVTQMGSQFKPGIFDEGIRSLVDNWASGHKHNSLTSMPSSIDTSQINRLEREPYHGVHVEEQERVANQRIISSAVELFPASQNHETLSS